jgi:hypothetical protein
MGVELHDRLRTVRKVRLKVFLALIGSVIFTSLFIVIAPAEKKTLFSDIIEPTSTAIAAGLSLFVVYRQKVDGLIGKAYLFLAAGLVLWLAAEVTWSYYESWLGIPIPTPSAADAFWLIGYGPFMYYVLLLYNFFHRANTKKLSAIIISVIVAFYLAYIINTTYAGADLSTPTNRLKFVVNIAYPILDMILIVPTALIILDFSQGLGNRIRGYIKSCRGGGGGFDGGKGGDLTSIPWIFLSFLIIAAADSGFAYASNAGWSEEDIWVWNPVYIAGYLVISAGLFWHERFFIFDEERMAKRWQQQN